MSYSVSDHDLQIEVTTQGCELTAAEIQKTEEGLSALKQVIHDFPVSSLHITVVYHARSHDYHVKTNLRLVRQAFFTGERHRTIYPAYERCIRKLIKKVEAFKHRMQAEDERTKQVEGTRHLLLPTQELDLEQLDAAIRNDDYVAFRKGVAVFEDGLNERVGRWIEPYPVIAAQLGDAITIGDLVEEIYLHAFDRFADRPQNLLPGQWFESLIDPSVQAILQSPDEEFQNISFARSLLEA